MADTSVQGAAMSRASPEMAFSDRVDMVLKKSHRKILIFRKVTAFVKMPFFGKYCSLPLFSDQIFVWIPNMTTKFDQNQPNMQLLPHFEMVMNPLSCSTCSFFAIVLWATQSMSHAPTHRLVSSDGEVAGRYPEKVREESGIPQSNFKPQAPGGGVRRYRASVYNPPHTSGVQQRWEQVRTPSGLLSYTFR